RRSDERRQIERPTMNRLLACLALGMGLLAGGAAALAQTPAAVAASAPAAAAPASAAPAAVTAAPEVKPAATAPAAAAAASAPATAASAPPAPVPNKGDVSWMIVATAFVIMMSIPGLALFYGGLVRSKNMLSVLMQVFVTFSLIVILWCLYGYSLAFTEGNQFVGGFDRVLMRGLFDPLK